MNSRLLTSAWYSLVTRITGPGLAPLALDLFEMPETGPLVIVSSHVSWTDHLALGTVTALRRSQPLAFLSHNRFHRHAAVRALWHRPLLSLPVDGGQTEASLASCRTILGRGGAVCVYPTGRLLAPTVPGSFRPGAFRLARETEAAILLVGIAYGPKAKLAPRWMTNTPTVAFELMPRESVAAMTSGELLMRAEQRVIALEARVAAAGEADFDEARQQWVEWAEQLDVRSATALRVSDSYNLRSRGRLTRATATWAARTRASA